MTLRSNLLGLIPTGLGFLSNNADIDLVMGHLQFSDLKVLRVWVGYEAVILFHQKTKLRHCIAGFNDITSSTSCVWFQINTGTNGLQRLDYVVSGDATNDWAIAGHSPVCASVGKPCIAQEYSVTYSKASVEGAW
jgi:hypothetical protein